MQMIEIEDIEKVCEVFEKHNISYLEYKRENSSIIIKGNKNSKKETFDECLKKAESSKEEISKKEDSKKDLKEEKKYIKSTLMGRFYATKEKGKEPLVKVGDVIKSGSVVGVIEVMKLFNDVISDVDGEILNILVKDGDLVEYGQPLIELKWGGEKSYV